MIWGCLKYKRIVAYKIHSMLCFPLIDKA
ncbi:hypothetical protein V12B01_12870 [Vibrio splendidus 12B01]|nr:hypothetical protein V12B01_12870 [Vibrio splendidus 12B01]